jgi:hypothetical protein
MIRQMVSQTNQSTRTYQQMAQMEEQNARELERLVQREHQTAQTIQNMIRTHEQTIQQLNQLQSLVGQISQSASMIQQNYQISSQYSQNAPYSTPIQYGQAMGQYGQFGPYGQDATRQSGQMSLSPTAQAALGQSFNLGYQGQTANQASTSVSGGFGQVGSQFGPNGQDHFSPSQTISPMVSSYSGGNGAFRSFQ